jgi:transcription factor SPT20
MQPRVYANVQAATEAATASSAVANRTPTPQTTQSQQQQQHYQLQLLQKAQQQQQQTMQASPKVPSVLPQTQPSQSEQPRPTPTPKPSVTPAPIQPAASSSGGPYPNQFIMQVAQAPSQQPAQPVPTVQQPRTQPQPTANQMLAHLQSELGKTAEALKTDPTNESLTKQLTVLRAHYQAFVQRYTSNMATRAGQAGVFTGRATPQISAAILVHQDQPKDFPTHEDEVTSIETAIEKLTLTERVGGD